MKLSHGLILFSILVNCYVASYNAPKKDYLIDYFRQLNPYENNRYTQCINLDKELRRISLKPDAFECFSSLVKNIVQNRLNLARLLVQGQILILPGQVAADHFLERKNPNVDLFPGSIEAAERTQVLLAVLERLFKVQKWQKPVYEGADLSSFCKPRNRFTSSRCPTATSFQSDPDCLYQNRGFRSLNRLAEPHCVLNCDEQKCELPNARELSLLIGEQYKIRKAKEEQGRKVPTVLGLNYFQLAIHDSVRQKIKTTPEGNRGFSACSADNKRNLDDLITHPDSVRITVSCSDPFYSQFNVTCLEFIRAQTVNDKCQLKELSFLNLVTPEFDLSTVYGDLPDFAEKLIGHGGLFKTNDSDGLPIIYDPRSKQTDQLLSTHIVYIKFHDSAARSLKILYPNWNDRQVFYQAKYLSKIVNELLVWHNVLPVFLGEKVTAHYGLNDPSNCYDPQIDTQTLAEFSCAAGRFIHVFCSEKIQLADAKYRVFQEIDLHQTFVNDTLTKSDYKSFVRGLAITPVSIKHLSSQMQNHLFTGKHGPFGHDMFTIDVTRSRDCCLKPYVHYLKQFFGACVRDFDDLCEFLPQSAIKALKKTYKKVNDVDLYVGGALEPSFEDGLIGRTFAHIIGLQYRRYKCGNPYFYSAVLNNAQKAELVKTEFNQLLAILADLDLTPENSIHTHPGIKLVPRKYKYLHEALDLKVLINQQLVQQYA